ncbi:MAG: YkgJ family cysteine cluster protein [Deltaproteobacteria bacterium]|jgi:Fe-S-cluster containining protein|nr:YkgJ family cysteine cluster protein [Deltaproteobacteria bacterium]
MTEKKQNHGPASDPTGWDRDALEAAFTAHLKTMVSEDADSAPLARVRYQALEDPACRELLAGWDELEPRERPDAWERLTEAAVTANRELLPTCIRCGTCCRRGSPTLLAEDLELVAGDLIPASALVTLRAGEPAHSPYAGSAFFLPEERIKLREKPGTSECVFFATGEGDEAACKIYKDRPTQCRAQACWDPDTAKQLAAEPHLGRRDVFAGVDTLLEMIAEHDDRCSFARLRAAFDDLHASGGEQVQPVIDLLAFEDHFRSFVAEKLGLPDATLDLVFGRPLYDRVRLFGFRVEIAEDGTRTLVPAD